MLDFILMGLFIIPPANFVYGGYTVSTLSVCPSVRPCIRASVRNVLFPKYLEESSMAFDGAI